MVQTIKLVLRKKDKLVVDLSIDLQPSESRESHEQLVAGESPKAGLKTKQRFHLRNHVHYGHQVNLGHHHANSQRVNRRQLLRSEAMEQPADLLEQLVQNKSRMIELHAF